MDDSKILLENGTNELMILEFMVGGNYYGINVAKMCESCGLSWDYGTKHVAFFGIYMMSSIC